MGRSHHASPTRLRSSAPRSSTTTASLGVRAAHVRARDGRGRPRHRGLHARLLPARPGSLPRDHDDEAVARDAQEPEAPQAPRAVSRREREALLQAGHRATRPASTASTSSPSPPPPARARPAGRRRLPLRGGDRGPGRRARGAEIAADYAEREPLLVGVLQGEVVFFADLSRATPDPSRARLRGAGRLRRGPGGRPRRVGS